jgi:hypothetical protein
MKLLILLALLSGCSGSLYQLPTPPPPVSDSGCDQAQARLDDLECHIKYAPVCKERARLGASSPTLCISLAETCSSAMACTDR